MLSLSPVNGYNQQSSINNAIWPSWCLPLNSSDETLSAALARHQIELPAAQVALLQRYCELLWDWNAKINLTRHTDYEKFVARDLVDSLAFAQFWQPKEKVLDVGTGGGVPGVVLAIVRDDLKVSLSESVGKKARAVADIVERLGLPTPVLPRPRRGRLAPTAVRHAGGSGGGAAEEAAGMVQAALGLFRPAAGAERALVGRRARRGPALRTDARPGAAETDFVSAAGHRVGERAAANPPEGRLAVVGRRPVLG